MSRKQAMEEQAIADSITHLLERGADTVASLEAAVRAHQARYDDGEPIVPDAAFDTLVERLRHLSPKSPVLDELGSARTSKRAPHDVPMLSLEKATSESAVLTWTKKSTADAFVLAPKYDGLALSLTYTNGKLVRAVTRGDGAWGDDVTANVKHMPSVPARLSGAPPHDALVRGEAMFRRDAPVLADFANARNAAAGTLMRKTANKRALAELEFVAYDMILAADAKPPAYATLSGRLSKMQEFGLVICDSVCASFPDDLDQLIDDCTERWSAPDYPYECDGLVVKVDPFSLREELGATSHHPRWAIALKFHVEGASTALTDVLWQVSRTGAITPVAVVSPVKLSGAMVERATLHNLAQIKRLGLRVPCVVSMTRRGGVIPHIESMTSYIDGAEPVAPPKACPGCGERTAIDGDVLRCSEPEHCPPVAIATIHHWCATLDMLGWGAEMIGKLYNDGVIRMPDVYDCDDALAKLGPTLGRKLAKERDAKRKVTPETFIAALGFPGIGKTQAAKLLERFGDVRTILDLCERNHDRLQDELTPALFDNLTDGYVALGSDQVHALLEAVKLVEPVRVVGGPLSGKSFVFTGKLTDMEREEARELVRSLGADAPDSVTKKITHLVVGDLAREEQRTKREKVAKYNATGSRIELMEESAFIAMIAEVQ